MNPITSEVIGNLFHLSTPYRVEYRQASKKIELCYYYPSNDVDKTHLFLDAESRLVECGWKTYGISDIDLHRLHESLDAIADKSEIWITDKEGILSNISEPLNH